MSCEGAIEAQQPAFAPCSGKPCVYFEIELVQEWEKHVVTEGRTQDREGQGHDPDGQDRRVFFVNDGSGPVAVDPREGMTVELDKSFEQTQNVSHGDVMFGQFHAHVPHAGGDKHGRGVKVIEKIVPVEGGMFVMGQLANQAITKPKGMLGSLMASRKGRNALLGATKRNKLIGFIAGGVFFLPGVGLSIFADPPAPTAAGAGACNILDESKANTPCTGKIYNDDGTNVELTVTQAGTFDIQGGPPRGKKIPVIASIGVKGSDGKVYIADAHEQTTVDLQPGKYAINIKDSIPGGRRALQGRLQLRAPREAHRGPRERSGRAGRVGFRLFQRSGRRERQGAGHEGRRLRSEARRLGRSPGQVGRSPGEVCSPAGQEEVVVPS